MSDENRTTEQAGTLPKEDEMSNFEMATESVKNIGDRATWELKAIIKALTFMEIFNTDDDNIRLKSARLILKSRKRSNI